MTACSKETPLLGMRSLVTLDTPLTLQLDSTCLHAPNIITVNGDGINDRFSIVYGEPVQELTLSIMNPNGTTLYTSNDKQPHWGGFDAELNQATGPIPYLYTLHVVTMEGQVFQTSKVFHVVRDINIECITADVAPLFGDMLDPRLCNVPYETNDMVCIE
jgi:hypothetical protein